MNKNGIFELLSLSLSDKVTFIYDEDNFIVKQPGSRWFTDKSGTESIKVLLGEGILTINSENKKLEKGCKINLSNKLKGLIIGETKFEFFIEDNKPVIGIFNGYFIECGEFNVNGETRRMLGLTTLITYNNENYNINIKELNRK